MGTPCRAFHTTAVAVFALVAAVQALRVLAGWPVEIAGTAVPALASIAVALAAAVLAVWGWRTRR